MNQREKTLVGAIAGLGALWGAWSGYGSYQAGYQRRERTLAEREEELFQAGVDARRARQSLRRLESYQEASLPSDPDVARSVYSAWLIDTLSKAGLELGSVKWASTRDYAEAGTALTFTATAQGAPEGVVKFLDAYHRLGLLHQLTNLQLRPADEEGAKWGLSLTSVAMIVEGTTREAGLPEAPLEPSRLALASADEYVASVVGRNVFASYTPPPPPAPPEPPAVAKKDPPPKPTPPPFDDSEHAALSGIVGYGDAYEAWVVVRTTGVTLRLHDGDTLEVGQFKGRVESVRQRAMTIVAEDGAKFTVDLGEKLREAQKPPKDAA